MKNVLKGILVAVCAVSLVIGLAGCQNNTSPHKDNGIPVTGVTLDKTKLTVTEGKTATLTATVSPENAKNKDVLWSTSNAGIATVANGVVTGVAEGTATITVKTVDGNKTATCEVTVAPAPQPGDILVTSVLLNKQALSLTAGNTEELTVTVLPANATNQRLNWESSNSAVASVEDGIVTAVAAGTATITVKPVYGESDTIKDTCTVTVTANTAVGSGQYEGKDVLGNTYTLSVGSSVPSARAAHRGDRYQMNIKTRDGKIRTVSGTVEEINTDGTLTLQPDKAGADEFTAVVDGGELNSVVGENIPFTGTEGASDLEITPRTFDGIYLRAARWENTEGWHGENWGSGNSVLVTDFASNVSELAVSNDWDNPGQYTITVSGTSSVAIPYPAIEIQGITEEGLWIYLAGKDQLATDKMAAISANTPFERTVVLNVWEAHSLLGFKEVVMQFTNVINQFQDGDDTMTVDHGTIPADVNDGDIMAAISNFKVSLKDTHKALLAGNMEDYHFGYQEDGLSIDYRQAVWTLSAENIAKAKVPGAKFEFFMMDVEYFGESGFDGPTIAFIWQDPVRGLWWQDQSEISGGDEYSNPQWLMKLGEGVTWEAWRHKISIDLATVINDSQFASATELNFIVACWWYGEGPPESIGTLNIAGGNIVEAHPATTGNMGNYRYGDASVKERAGLPPDDDYFLIEYSMAVWNLSEEAVALVRQPNAQLELVFNQDMEALDPALGLAWSDVEHQDYWVEQANRIRGWDEGTLQNVWGDGVSWNSGEKKLTIDLATAFSQLSGRDSNNIEFTLASWYNHDEGWGIDNINNLGIVSAAIVEGAPSTQTGTVSNPTYLWLNENDVISATEKTKTLSKATSQTLVINLAADSGYTVVDWYVDGTKVGGTPAASYTFTSADKTTGRHTVILVAQKGGKYYSVNFTITVTE